MVTIQDLIVILRVVAESGTHSIKIAQIVQNMSCFLSGFCDFAQNDTSTE